MTHPSGFAVIGKWRIVEADLWDRAYLDLMEPAYIQFSNDRGEFAFGAVTGGMDCQYGKRLASFTWLGNDEMDEASGYGEATHEDDGTLTIELRFHTGDEAQLKAVKW